MVFTSIGGDSARVRLSNVFGSKNLQIRSAFLAVRISDASIKPGSSVAVTFGGQDGVTLAPGTEVASDAAAFPVGALSEVRADATLPGAAGRAGGGDSWERGQHP